MIQYDDAAQADLEEIEAYFLQYSFKAMQSVARDIQSTIQAIATFSDSGRPLSENRRRLITPRYGFTISYRTNSDGIIILGIYRYQNRTS